MPFHAFAAVVSAVAAFGADATAQSPEPPTRVVSPVVVTATLTPTPIDRVGSSITLITGEAIDAHQWRTLPDVLAAAPGLNTVQTGGPGGLTSVFIRGANANHTEVIIDGIEVNDPSHSGAYDFGQGLAAGVEKIEILRGPASSLYGADALGGVIDIVTPEGEGRPTLTLAGEAGSFDTTEETANLAGSTGRFHYVVNLAHFRSGDTPVTPPGLLPPGVAAIGDRYDNLSGHLKLGYDLADDVRLGLVAHWARTTYRSTGENFDRPFPLPPAPDAAQTVQWERQVFTRASLDFPLFAGAMHNAIGMAYANFHTVEQSPDDGLGLPAAVIDNGDHLKADWLGRVRLSRQDTLLLGVDETIDRLIDRPVSARESRSGGFAELQLNPAPGLNLAASVRYDSDDRYGGYATWRLAPAYTVAASGTVLKGSLGTGFKSPTLTELFVSFPAFDFFANPDLKPERSLGYDLGFEQPVLGGRLRIGATWFHNDIRDLIDSNAAFTSWANVGRATTYGVEGFVAAQASATLALRGDFTWLVARDDIAHGELLRRPKDKASVTAQWRPIGRLRLAASLIYVGAWRDFDRSGSFQLMASPFATVDLSGDLDLGRGVSLFARVDNLLNRRYEDPVGFDKPGIGAFGGLRLSIGP